jgi:hypothetical protein
LTWGSIVPPAAFASSLSVPPRWSAIRDARSLRFGVELPAEAKATATAATPPSARNVPVNRLNIVSSR